MKMGGLNLDRWEKASRFSCNNCPPLHTDAASSERIRAYGGIRGPRPRVK
jgi:hypothetical protein